MTKAIKTIQRLKTEYQMPDPVALKLVAAYADKISDYLRTPTVPGTLPITFEEYVDSLVSGKSVESRDADSPVVSSEVNIREKQPPPGTKVASNKQIERYEFEVTEEELKLETDFIGKSSDTDEMAIVWEKVYELPSGDYVVKLAAAEGYKNAIIPQLIDKNGLSIKRLRPKTDGIRGEYTFAVNETKSIVFVLE